MHTFKGTYADLSIAPNGQIRVIDPKGPAVGPAVRLLESISFRRFGLGNSIAINASNWSPAGFGATPPGWYKDPFGIVHLRGAAKQTFSVGLNANLLGTLPIAATPTRAFTRS